jgi:hypothetical protein
MSFETDIISYNIAGNTSRNGSMWGTEISIISRKQWNLEVSWNWRIPML